jgi:hypothetical protein
MAAPKLEESFSPTKVIQPARRGTVVDELITWLISLWTIQQNRIDGNHLVESQREHST